MKDEKCDLYVRYTTSLEEKSATIVRNRDLQLEVRNQIVCVCMFEFFTLIVGTIQQVTIN